jgi:hypothetical protein
MLKKITIKKREFNSNLFGYKFRIIVLKQLKSLVGSLSELLLTKSRRILKIVNLNNSRDTGWSEVEFSNTFLQRLNPPTNKLVSLLIIGESILIQFLVLKLTKNIVINRVTFFVITIGENNFVPISSEIFLKKCFNSEFLLLEIKVR